jgi:site-specific recombinase XerD
MVARTRGSGRIFQPTYPGPDGERRTVDTYSIAYYDRRAKREQREHGFATAADAERRLRARLADQDRGITTGPAGERLTFEDLEGLIKEDYEINKRKTKGRVLCHLDHLRQTFGGVRAVEITAHRLGHYIKARLGQGAENGTVNRELTTLKRMFNLAARDKRLSRDAVPYIEMLEEDNIRKGFFEEQQLRAVLPHLKVRSRRVVLVAYITGWRVHSDILTRRWTHVDFANGWLRMEPGEPKCKEGRWFPLDIDPRLRKTFEEAKEVADRVQRKRGIIIPWCFHSDNGKRRLASFRKDWNVAREKAGLRESILHDFRRTAVRNLLRAGVSQVLIKSMVGMKTNSIFERYAIVDESIIREAAAKVRAGGELGSATRADAVTQAILRDSAAARAAMEDPRTAALLREAVAKVLASATTTKRAQVGRGKARFGQ